MAASNWLCVLLLARLALAPSAMWTGVGTVAPLSADAQDRDAGPPAAPSEQVSETLNSALPANSTISVSARQAAQALLEVERNRDWRPRANDELSRGPAAVVYPNL